MRIVGLGRAGCAADTVATGATAEQNYNITRCRNFSANIFLGSSSNNRANLHTLCSIAGMINLIYNTGCKTDLVTVGRIPCSRSRNDLTLRKLAFDRILHRLQRICRTGYTHRTVNIGSAGKRISDRTADTSSGAAKGLDFGRMVMGLILKQKKPRFFLTVCFNFDLHRASIDLFGFVQLVQLPVLAQIFYRNGSKIHQTD